MTFRRAHSATRSTATRRATARTVLGTAALLAAGSGPAMAQSSPYYIGGAVTYAHDSNLLRLPDGQLAPANYSKADSTLSTALLAGMDQRFGRQRAYGTLSLRSNRLSSNTVYNNDSYALNAGLDWSTIERISGLLSVNASRSLSTFDMQEVGLLVNKNQESAEGFEATIRVGLVTEYSLEATAGTRQTKNSLQDPRIQARNFKQDNISVGLRWLPSDVTRLGLSVRATVGRYPKFRAVSATEFEADRFKRQDVDLTLWHRLSGFNSFEMRLSTGKTRYDLATQRDFTGLTGSLAWNWAATGKTNINLRLSHDTGQDSTAYTFINMAATSDLSRVSDSLLLQADYAMTAKVALKASLAYFDRDLVRTLPSIFGPFESSGTEKSTTLSFGARWAPYPTVQLGCDLRHETRRGTGALGSDLGASTYSCFGQVTLQ